MNPCCVALAGCRVNTGTSETPGRIWPGRTKTLAARQRYGASRRVGGRLVGFLRDRSGRFTSIQPPGAAATLVTDLNDRGQIVLDSSDVGADELFGGTDGDSFLLDRGVYRAIVVPDASRTVVNAINNRGEMAGSYVDAAGTWHGLLRDRKGRHITTDHPDAAGLGTTLYSINDHGQTTGAYLSPVEPSDPAPQRHSTRATSTGRPLIHPADLG